MDGLSELNPVMVGTPWLFWELFSGIDDHRFLQVAEAGMYQVLASILLDHLIDKHIQSPESAILLHQSLYAAGEAKYRAIFSDSENFWAHYDRLATDHITGLSMELESRIDPRLLSEDNLRISSDGKVSPIVTTIAALTELSGQPTLLDPIERSLKHIAIASQLLDDVGDWQEDLQSGHLTNFMGRLSPVESWTNSTWPTQSFLQLQIDNTWMDVTCLGDVKAWLALSISEVEGLGCPGWVTYVQGYWDRADHHQTRFTAGHIHRVIGPMVQME